MIMMILASGSRILVARIIQFEVESNCETFLQMSIISISIRANPLSSLNVKYFVAFVTRQYDHHIVIISIRCDITTYDDDNDYDDNYDNHHRRILSYCCQGECSHPCIGTNPLPRGQSGRVPQFNAIIIIIMITLKLIMMMTTSIDNGYFGNFMQDVVAIPVGPLPSHF